MRHIQLNILLLVEDNKTFTLIDSVPCGEKNNATCSRTCQNELESSILLSLSENNRDNFIKTFTKKIMF